MNDFTISQLARAVNISVETIRYYERVGLVRKPPRSANGYRHYEDRDASQLHFIHNSQALGFTLKEIKQLLKMPVDGIACCTEVYSMIESKLAHVRGQIQQLQSIESRLQHYTDINCSNDATCPLFDDLWPDRQEARNRG